LAGRSKVPRSSFATSEVGVGWRSERVWGVAFLGEGVKAMDAMLENHWRTADQLGVP
jgi:hypothetical protein